MLVTDSTLFENEADSSLPIAQWSRDDIQGGMDDGSLTAFGEDRFGRFWYCSTPRESDGIRGVSPENCVILGVDPDYLSPAIRAKRVAEILADGDEEFDGDE